MKIAIEVKAACRSLYIRTGSAPDCAKQLNVNVRTVYNWIKDGNWDELRVDITAQQVLASRICTLAERDNKTKLEIEELDRLCRTAASFDVEAAKAEKIRAEANRIQAEADHITHNGEALPGKTKGANKGKAKNPTKKNDISSIDAVFFETFANKHFYQYQLNWRANIHQRNRFILKPRQIGATYYFAFEAFEDAVKHGENQIFLSASKAQSKVFKSYIIAFALEHFDIELKGADSIELYKDGKLHATLYFLSTNASTAQSYHGHLYIDEVFWIPNYDKLQKVASAMAAHKKWRRTYFSTPSSIQHPAYKQWSGDKYNKNRKQKVDFDLSEKTLLDGHLGPDNIWRCMLNIYDAQAQGCDLFDIDELKQEYTKEDFDNLFMCQFIDDLLSVFPFSELQPCMIDAASLWLHLKSGDKPLGNRPAAIGYDPSRLRDNAALSLLEMPLKPTKKWRLIEKQQFKGQSSEYQAARISEYLDRFNIQHIGIDITGIGYGVYEQIENIPQVMPIYYSIQTKTELVMNAKRIIQSGRFEYDSSHMDITQSFMQITQQTTPSGVITYGASRSAETGHADIAWSIMHAMYVQKFNQNNLGGKVITASSN